MTEQPEATPAKPKKPRTVKKSRYVVMRQVALDAVTDPVGNRSAYQEVATVDDTTHGLNWIAANGVDGETYTIAALTREMVKVKTETKTVRTIVE